MRRRWWGAPTSWQPSEPPWTSLTLAAPGRLRCWVRRGSGRRGCCANSRAGLSGVRTLFSRGRRRSWSATCRSRPSSTRWMSTWKASAPTACRRLTTTCKQNSHAFSRRWLRSPAAGSRHCNTSAIEAIARCARCSHSWRTRRRSSSSLTTSTGPTRRQSNCSGRCCAARRLQPCWSRSRSDRVTCRSSCRLRSHRRLGRQC